MGQDVGACFLAQPLCPAEMIKVRMRDDGGVDVGKLEASQLYAPF